MKVGGRQGGWSELWEGRGMFCHHQTCHRSLEIEDLKFPALEIEDR